MNTKSLLYILIVILSSKRVQQVESLQRLQNLKSFIQNAFNLGKKENSNELEEGTSDTKSSTKQQPVVTTFLSNKDYEKCRNDLKKADSDHDEYLNETEWVHFINLYTASASTNKDDNSKEVRVSEFRDLPLRYKMLYHVASLLDDSNQQSQKLARQQSSSISLSNVQVSLSICIKFNITISAPETDAETFASSSLVPTSSPINTTLSPSSAIGSQNEIVPVRFSYLLRTENFTANSIKNSINNTIKQDLTSATEILVIQILNETFSSDTVYYDAEVNPVAIVDVIDNDCITEQKETNDVFVENEKCVIVRSIIPIVLVQDDESESITHKHITEQILNGIRVSMNNDSFLNDYF